MSTYVFSKNNTFEDCPELVRDYLKYLRAVKDRSNRTVNAYYIDLRVFLMFLVKEKIVFPGNDSGKELLDEREVFFADAIKGLRIDFFEKITKNDIYDFLFFVSENRNNSPVSRARKLSAIKGFYKYLTISKGLLRENIVKDFEMPHVRRALPKYLTLDESKRLLSTDVAVFYEREYCMLTLFLNCGMRLCELCSINVSDYKDDSIRVIGKGRKERIVYLNDACIKSLEIYLAKRNKINNIIDNNAMFISEKTKKRLSSRRVQQLVSAAISSVGLGGQGFSVHKLRHTAATLMYQFGNADMLALKEILGHEHVSTTEIYTHISNEQLKKAAKSSPLGDIEPIQKK